MKMFLMGSAVTVAVLFASALAVMRLGLVAVNADYSSQEPAADEPASFPV